MFKKKKISCDIVGEIFKYERERNKYTIRDVAEKIGVKEEYILYLEEGDYLKLPAPIYAKNFLKKYLDFLDLDERLLHRFEKELKILKEKQQKKYFKVLEGYVFSLNKILRVVTIFLFILFFLSYIGYSIYKVLSAPDLKIYYPSKDLVLNDFVINVYGQVDQNSKVQINGDDVFVDKYGIFKNIVVLQPGLNIIRITAKKKYSKMSLEERKIVVLE